VFVCLKAKKDLPVETSKGKKAPVIPKNSKVSDAPQTELLTESPEPADIQPG